MKNAMVILVLLAFSLPIFAQERTRNAHLRQEDYLIKSRRKERAGIILLSAGGLVTAGSTLLIIDGVHRNERDGYGNYELNSGNAEIIVGFLGGVMGVAAMSA